MGILTATLLAGAISPLFLVHTPAMLDYVNHTARMYFLSGAPSRAYSIHWGLYPDLAMDLIVPPLAKATGVATACKLFWALIESVFVSGAAFLEMSVKGRHRLGGLAALLVLYSLPAAWGLANFMFGLGLALWGLGLWIRTANIAVTWRWLMHMSIVAALFITHFFALGVYGLTIGLYELSRLKGSLVARELLGRLIFMASPMVVVLAMIIATGGGIGHASTFDWDFGLKALWLAIFLNVYDVRLSILSAILLVALLAILTVSKRLKISSAGVWISGGLAILYLTLPRQLFGSDFQDVRLLTAAGAIAPAFIRLNLTGKFWRVAPLLTVCGIVVVNDIAVARAWVDDQTDFTQFRQTFALLEPGARVLVAVREGDVIADQPIYYAATLAAPARDVFVSSLYAYPGMQPLRPSAAYQSLQVAKASDYAPPTLARLVAAMGVDPQPAPGIPPHLTRWPARYQYLYLVGTRGANPLPGALHEIGAGRRFSLYKIDGCLAGGRVDGAALRPCG